MRAALALAITPLVALRLRHGEPCCAVASLISSGFSEIMLGAALGLTAQVVAGGATAAGGLIDAAIAQSPIGPDWLSGDAAGPVARLYSLGFGAVFFFTGAFARLVERLMAAPAFGLGTLFSLHTVTALGRECIGAAITLAWPALCAALFAAVIAGAVGRLAPRVNVMFFAAPLATTLTLAALLLSSGAIFAHFAALSAAAVGMTRLIGR